MPTTMILEADLKPISDPSVLSFRLSFTPNQGSSRRLTRPTKRTLQAAKSMFALPNCVSAGATTTYQSFMQG